MALPWSFPEVFLSDWVHVRSWIPSLWKCGWFSTLGVLSGSPSYAKGVTNCLSLPQQKQASFQDNLVLSPSDNLSVMLSHCGILSLIDKAVLKSYYKVFCLPLKQTNSQMRQTSVGHGRDPWLCLPDGKQLWFAATVPICAASESSWRSKTALAFIWDWWSSAAQIHLRLHNIWAGGLLEMWWEGSTGWMGGTASFQSTSCPTSGRGWTVPLAFSPTPKVWSARGSG